VTAPARPRRRRWPTNLIWVVLGVLLYAACIDVFGGYPQVHSEALNWIAVVVLVLLGAFVWYRDEQRDDEP
jgi:uncharacterized membrane protein YdcZ (DUF606 family)